jgi:type II secretory pathway pseudopilin PulG
MSRDRLISLRRRLASSSGYTLIELITVLAMLLAVLAGLTTMFNAGLKAQVRAERELDAQRNARSALDRMRRELHCANAISSPNATTVVVTLPAACPGTDTNVTYAATSVVPSERYTLTRTPGGGSAVIIADYLTTDALFTYTAPATGSLGRLSVNIPVNLNPDDTSTLWRLEDDIVLRNTTRL